MYKCRHAGRQLVTTRMWDSVCCPRTYKWGRKVGPKHATSSLRLITLNYTPQSSLTIKYWTCSNCIQAYLSYLFSYFVCLLARFLWTWPLNWNCQIQASVLHYYMYCPSLYTMSVYLTGPFHCPPVLSWSMSLLTMLPLLLQAKWPWSTLVRVISLFFFCAAFI